MSRNGKLLVVFGLVLVAGTAVTTILIRKARTLHLAVEDPTPADV